MHKNIIFDCGNVLYHWNRDLVLSKFIKDKEERQKYIDSIFKPWPKKDMGLPKDEFYKLAISDVPEKYHAAIKEFSDTWMKNIGPVERVHSLIKNELYGKHKIYLLSNIAPEFYEEIYLKEDIFKYFDGYVISGLIGMVKPHDDIYEYLLDKYNLDPKECLFIDDRLDNLNKAKEFGIDVFQFDEFNSEGLVEFLKENNDI